MNNPTSETNTSNPASERQGVEEKWSVPRFVTFLNWAMVFQSTGNQFSAASHEYPVEFFSHAATGLIFEGGVHTVARPRIKH
jgi:hypothetical protein